MVFPLVLIFLYQMRYMRTDKLVFIYMYLLLNTRLSALFLPTVAIKILITVSRVVESASSGESSKEHSDNHRLSSRDSGPPSDVEPEREKTEEEKANWMAEYAPFFESMYDKVKRKRVPSAKGAQNTKSKKKDKRRRKRRYG